MLNIKLEIKKNFKSIDLFLLLMMFFGVKLLYKAFRKGEFIIRGVLFSTNQSPIIFWAMSIILFCIAVSMLIHLLFYDFKKHIYLISCKE